MIGWVTKHNNKNNDNVMRLEIGQTTIMRVQGSSSSKRQRRSFIPVIPHQTKWTRSAGDHDVVGTPFIRLFPFKRRKRQVTNNSTYDSLDCRNIINNDSHETMDENFKDDDRIERHRRLQQVNELHSNSIDDHKSI